MFERIQRSKEEQKKPKPPKKNLPPAILQKARLDSLNHRHIQMKEEEEKSHNKQPTTKYEFVSVADCINLLESFKMQRTGIYKAFTEYYRISDMDAYGIFDLDNYGKEIYLLNVIKDRIREWKHLRNLLHAPKGKKWELINGIESFIEKKDPIVRENGKKRADQVHNEDREWLKKYVDTKTADPRLKSLYDNHALFVLTPTGDSCARVITAGKDPNEYEAYFPTGLPGAKGDISSTAESYNHKDLKDNTNIIFLKKSEIFQYNSPALAVVRKKIEKDEDIQRILNPLKIE